MFRFAKKLNIQNYVNWRRNYVHYICIECLDLQKNWISRTPKIQREILYIIYIYIYIRNVWICRKIESLELRKFNGKLFTLCMYGIFGFAEKLNILNRGNSTGNCVRYMYVVSGFAEKLNVQNCINSKENCACYMYEMFWFAVKLNI